MIQRTIVGCLISAAAVASLFSNAAIAHEFQPFVCTPSGTEDGSAVFVTQPGRRRTTLLNLKTAANGNSSAGATLTDIDSNKTLGSLTFTLAGTNTATDGPFAVITGHYTDGTPVSKVIPCSKARVVRTIGSTKYLSIGPKELGTTQTLSVDECDFEMFPGAANNSAQIGNVIINNSTVVLVTNTNHSCPLGTQHF
jgi:hypothetical protein